MVAAEGSMRTLVVGVIAVAATGCASFQNTAAQDRVWARYAVCSGESRGIK